MVGPHPLRLGVVPYLNVAPMIHGLDGDPSVRLIRDVPSKLLKRLLAGEMDAGTVPSIDYVGAANELRIISGIAIASRGPVRSVRLVHWGLVEDVKTVALDSSSHTSVALLKVLLRERLGRDPEYVTCAPDLDAMLARADAALLIGDPALFSRGDHAYLDLGAEWTALTGLPFVYAFWAARANVVSAAQVRRLKEALYAGQSAIPDIAAAYNGAGSKQPELCESYLRENVSYRLGDEERRGLLEFYRRCQAQGLIDRVPELRFHGDS
jgi:chorismate dehydratase